MSFDTKTEEGEPEPDRGVLEPADGSKRGRKFYAALACYAAIALLAALTLEGKALWVVWIFLGWFALKTYLATLQKP